MESNSISNRRRGPRHHSARAGWQVPLALALGLLGVFSAGAQEMANLFFLHHSTGNGLIVEGDMRGVIGASNSAHGTAFAFWDHGYSGDGLRNPAGEDTGVSYGPPTDNTNPDGLHAIFTSAESDCAACRAQILANHQVIAFKSCFPASAITDAAMLSQYKTWYLEMRAVFDLHPDKLFVVMSTPPLHRLATSAVDSLRARQFANWLKSGEYLSGHTNVVCFDLFNHLADDDNVLKYEYEGSHTGSDSHPNELANQTVGPLFANFLIASALGYVPTNAPAAPTSVAIRANGATDRVAVAYPEAVSVTVEATAGSAAGTDVDWWALACAVDSGEWYYLDSALAWTPFSGDLGECQPAHQGPLTDLPAATVLNAYQLPRGTFNFYFAIDLLDGVLNYPAGPILYDAVTVVVE